jgi:hypothetical protein
LFTNRFFRLLVVMFMVTLFGLVPQALVFAGQSVDPATLNPPVPPEFNPTCEAIGSGTICHLPFSDPPVVMEGTGLICGSGASSFEVFNGTFMNPLTNATVSFDQSDTVIHNLAVPGDINTGTVTISGATRLHRPDGGIVLIDAGRAFLAAGIDWTLIKENGQHPFDAYYVFGDTSALQPLCDALE